MQAPADSELLRQYADQRSEEAFSALVARHLTMVYSVAFRKTGNAHAAQEIAQAVFIVLAKKAASLPAGTVLSGWLYEAARLTALNHLRGEIRRTYREQEAFMQSLETAPELWPQIAPLLDDAMGGLAPKDRDVLALRFFEGKSFSEIAAAVGATENAAKKRVGYALEKLRRYFSRRGVDSSTTAIDESISANSMMAAPAGLAAAIAAAAVQGSAATATTLTLAKGTLKVMAWTKMKTALVVSVAALVAVTATTGTVVAVKKSNTDRVENYFAHWDKYNFDTVSLPDIVLLRPSRYASQGNLVLASGDMNPEGRLMRRGTSFAEVLQTAYGFGPEQMVLPPNLPRGKFDLLLTAPQHSRERLRQEIKKQYGLVAHPETRDTDVLVLKVVQPDAPGLKPSAGGGPNIWENPDNLKLIGYKVSDPAGYDIAHLVGSFYNKPVIDETGLTGAYDVDVKWNAKLRGAAMQKEIERLMRDQLGLAVTPEKRPVEMLVVEKQNK